MLYLRLLSYCAFALLLPAAAGFAQVASCRLCAPQVQGEGIGKAEIPLNVTITAELDFSRAALTGSGGGMIRVDPQSGSRTIGGGLVDLGGYALVGTANVTGEPNRRVRIDLPSMINMTSADGGLVEIYELRTNLSPSPQLDTVGNLRFSFGGRLTVKGNASGSFRGRIPITASYE